MIMIYKYKRVLKLIKGYIKNPYILLDGCRTFQEGDHEHICLPLRLIGADFEKVCPHCNERGFEPEWSDCCDQCKYFGFIDFYTDSDNQKNISFGIDKQIIIKQND
jgi:hypothetical protein